MGRRIFNCEFKLETVKLVREWGVPIRHIDLSSFRGDVVTQALRH
jgi:hypothetical protein